MRPRVTSPLLAALFALSATGVRAQSGGQAELAVQGYYLRNGSQLALGTSGVALKFEEFLPEIGLLRGNLEAYRSGGSIQPADNYLQLRGLVWQGLRWNFSGGDFRASGTLFRNPFTNLFFPEINARGVQVEAGDSRRGYTLFYGKETLLAGPRIPFRIDVPQNVMGASIRQALGKLETGVRILHLENTGRSPSQNSFFPAGRDFRFADNLTLYSAYTFSDHLRWYGEVTAARAQAADGGPAGEPVSYFFGPAWESPRLTVRSNYANLTRSYFPVAGYWIGDRRGPFGEIRVRPFRRVELFGSANQYETTAKSTEKLPFLRSTGTSAGASLEFPFKVNASAQLSTTRFSSFDPATDATQLSYNRQWTGTLTRRIAQHTIRLTGRDMRLAVNGVQSRQKSVEAEDTFQIRRLVMGAAARGQGSEGTERRNSVYLRGSAQLNLGRLSAFGYFEGGKDLTNQTVFATSTTRSTVVSASYRVTRRWSLQGEAFRSRLISQLNPENLFVQGNQSLVLNPVLSQFNQWSFLFRVVRAFNWGGVIPSMGLDRYTAQRIPITGSVEGFIYVLMANGRQPAAGITVTLESGRAASTGVDGRYRLEDVPEGAHVVSIDMEQLPADYNPGPVTKVSVAIGPRKIARTDFELYSLAGFAGKLTASPGSEFESLEGIMIRLDPGGQFTTTAKDGAFAFYNLPDGTYQASIAANTLPPGARLKGNPAVPVIVRTGNVPPALHFEIERPPAGEKPVRKVLEKVIGLAPAAPSPAIADR